MSRNGLRQEAQRVVADPGELISGRLLVLDDDPDVCETLCGIAELAGYEAQFALDTEAFLHALDEWQPSHAVIDLALPGKDGIAMLRQLAHDGTDLKIIIISGLGTRILQAAVTAATEAGISVCGMLHKPFKSVSFKEMLAQAAVETERERSPLPAKSPPAAFAFEAEELEQTILDKQLVVHYQPKIDCRSGLPDGFEGLVRWPHPEMGMIAPDQFVPLAEATGLILPMTRLVLDEALRFISGVQAQRDLSIAVNISAASLIDPAFPDWVAGLCEQWGVAPRRLILEVTETASMQNPQLTLELLTQFRIRGFRLSIDDFGVGYSSLVQLARLPFSEMKIDKSFITRARYSEESQKIAMAIVNLAQGLDLFVTAEGVENEWTMGFLRDIGCDFAQGYWLGRPMPGEKVEAWLRDKASRK